MLFERIERILPGFGIKPFVRSNLDPCIPSPLAGEGQGEGGTRHVSAANTTTRITQHPKPLLDADTLAELLADEMVHEYVVKEFEYAKNIYGGRSLSKAQPWLSRDEVVGRNAQMAAPELYRRYREQVQRFVAAMPIKTRIFV